MKNTEHKINILYGISKQLIILIFILILLKQFNLFIIDSYMKISILSLVCITLFSTLYFIKYSTNKKFKTHTAIYFILSQILIILLLTTKKYISFNDIYLFIIFSSIASAILLVLSLKEKIFSIEQTKIPKYLIFILLIAFFALYTFHIQTIKYFDSDEVRLFFDAKQISDGKVAFQDFQARSPALIYPLSLFVKIVGNSYLAFYYLSIAINLISLYLVFELSKRLFNQKIGIYSVLIFGLAPIMTFLLWFKTQTFIIPIMLLSIILYDKYLIENKKTFLYLSFFLFFIGFFIRQTAIVYILGHIAILIYRSKEWGEVYEKGLHIINWFFVTIILYVIINGIFFTYGGFTLKSNIMNFFNLIIDDSSISRFAHIGYYISYYYIFLFISSLAIPIYALISSLKNYKKIESKKIVFIVPYFVIAGLFAIYLFNTYRLGFWPQYFMEFIPYFSIGVGILIYNLEKSMNKKWIKYTSLFLILILVLISNFYGILDMKYYKGAENRQGVIQVSSYIENITNQNDIIFAGSPIYSFMTDREHLMNLSHEYYDDYYVNTISSNLNNTLPDVIIADGRIRTYFLKNDNFKKTLDTRYSLNKSFNATDYNRTWKTDVYVLNTN